MNKTKLLFISILMYLATPVSSQQIKSDSARRADSINQAIVKREAQLKRTEDSINKVKAQLAKTADSLRPWHYGGIINIAFSQADFDNWASGGEDALGLVSLVSAHANYTKNKISWLSSVDIGYGFQKLDNQTLQKSMDKIEVTSNIGYNVFDHTLAGLLVDFKSQFAPGYQFPNNDSVLLSKFMAPGYLTIAAGLTYKPGKALSFFISPATLKYTFVEDQALADAGDFGVIPAVYDASGNIVTHGKEVLLQAGAYFKGDYSATVCKGINVTTDLSLFSNYIKNPQDIVIDWTTLIQMKVNRFISVTINTEMVYDQNVLIPIYHNDAFEKVPRTQFKEISGLGMAYNF